MKSYRAPLFGNLPPAIKMILVANIAVYLLDVAFGSRFNLTDTFALHAPQSDLFRPMQLVTYMFLHGSVTHIFFNMFAFVMFGRVLETVWGSKRFMLYYFVTGVGAALIQMLVTYIPLDHLHQQIVAFRNTPDPDTLTLIVREHLSHPRSWVNDLVMAFGEHPNDPQLMQAAYNLVDQIYKLNVDVPTVGASGAVFGVLLAFGKMFPNVELMLLFPPIPIKAKFMVIAYGLIELFACVMPQASDNVAHFAHLGGMLFGFFLIRYWNKKGDLNQYF